MNNKELITHAKKRIEAMGDAIDGCLDLLNGIYAERQLVSYLLWLSEKEENNLPES